MQLIERGTLHNTLNVRALKKEFNSTIDHCTFLIISLADFAHLYPLVLRLATIETCTNTLFENTERVFSICQK